MQAVPKDKRLFITVFLLLVSLHVALISTARLLPFTDLPDHLAAATIARYIDEPDTQFARYYTVDLFGMPNTFHLVFCSLRVFPSVELANRIFFILYALLLPLATLAVITKLGGNRWFSLLSFLLIYNYNVSWGFVGFAFAVPLVVVFYRLFLLERQTLESPAGILLAALCLILLFFVHVLAALFCLLLFLLAPAVPGVTSRRAFIGSLVAALPLAIVVALWWRGEAGAHSAGETLDFLSSYYRNSFLQTFAHRRGVFVFDNYHLYNGAKGYLLALVFSGAIVLSSGVFVANKRRCGAPDGGDSGAAPRSRAVPLVIASLLCVLLLPNEIPRQSVLYERFSVLLLLSVIIVGGALAPRTLPRAVGAVFAGLALFHFVLWSGYFVSFNRENAGFDRAFLRPAAGGQRLAGLVYDYTYRGRPIYIHFPSYYIVWERSVATAMITDYRFGPVRRNVGRDVLPRYLEWVARLGNYDGRYGAMEYILVRGRVGETVPASYLAGFGPARASGDWTLFGRTPPEPQGSERPKNN